MMMPFEPMLMAFSALLGFETVHAIRIWGLLFVALLSVIIWFKLKKSNLPQHLRILFWLTVLTSPGLRWGAGLARPEIFEGIIGIFLFFSLEKDSLEKKKWEIPFLLAMAAYTHFHGILWVPVILVWTLFRYPLANSFRKWFEIGLRTVVWLSPWILYVLFNFSIFQEQMEIQFSRLSITNPYTRDFYSYFHHLFMSVGNPVDYPKVFTVGKVITFLFLVIAGGVSLYQIITKRSPMAAALFAMIVMSNVMWMGKPEIWYVTLVHFAIWIALAFLATVWLRNKQVAVSVSAALFVLIGFQVYAQAWQVVQVSEKVSWKIYDDWAKCVHEKLGVAKTVWQPGWPDVLVNLSKHSGDRVYYRAADAGDAAMGEVQHLIDEHARTVDAIVYAKLLPVKETETGFHYEGEARDIDKGILIHDPWLDYKKWSGVSDGSRKISICQNGQFWAAVALK